MNRRRATIDLTALVTTLAFLAVAGRAAPDSAQAQAAVKPPPPVPSVSAAPAATPVPQSPLALLRNGREGTDNNQVITTGIRAPELPSSHALIITVSDYQRSPLPGVLTDRKLGIDLARRFGVPEQNIVELSERQVTREGLRQALLTMNESLQPGDRL